VIVVVVELLLLAVVDALQNSGNFGVDLLYVADAWVIQLSTW
jgi:hypothetical protein